MTIIANVTAHVDELADDAEVVEREFVGELEKLIRQFSPHVLSATVSGSKVGLVDLLARKAAATTEAVPPVMTPISNPVVVGSAAVTAPVVTNPAIGNPVIQPVAVPVEVAPTTPEEPVIVTPAVTSDTTVVAPDTDVVTADPGAVEIGGEATPVETVAPAGETPEATS